MNKKEFYYTSLDTEYLIRSGILFLILQFLPS